MFSVFPHENEDNQPRRRCCTMERTSRKGEATRQKLEYELAVIKKALNKEKQSARRNEQEAKDILRQHEGKAQDSRKSFGVTCMNKYIYIVLPCGRIFSLKLFCC